MDDYSSNVTEMRTTTDPGEASSESLATSLQGELERLRFAILETKQILDGSLSYWYESPAATPVSGPTSSTNNAVARFDGTSGSIQNSDILIDDNDVLTLADTTILTSSSNTTFSTTTAVDGDTWDLSNVRVGDVVSADGSIGTITAINDGTDTLTVASWDNGTPSNGSTATVLRRAALSVNGNGPHVIGANFANKVVDAVDEVDATFSNQIIDAYTRTTGTSVSERGVAVSDPSSNFTTSSTSAVDVTNLSVTITTSGRPVRLCLIGKEEEIVAFINVSENTSGDAFAKLTFVRDSTTVSGCTFGQQDDGSGADFFMPVSAFEYVDFPTAGTYTYKVQAYILDGTNVQIQDARLVAYEL